MPNQRAKSTRAKARKQRAKQALETLLAGLTAYLDEDLEEAHDILK